jgi:outer membrane protein
MAQDEENIRVRVGLGGQSVPQFIGADRNEWAPLWDVAVKRGTGPFDFEAPDDSFDIKLVSMQGFSAGPVASLQGGRKKSEPGAPLGKVPTTFEAGGFVQYQAGKSIRLRAELRKGIGGHEGIVAGLGADQVWRKGDRYLISIGPRLLLADARFQRAWFGVDAAASGASGLMGYRPGGGPYAIAATSGFNYQLSRAVGLFGFARYERLVGDAAKSPVVRDLGSRIQLSAGAGISYTFDIKR